MMKSKLAPLLIAITSSFLLVGCCTTKPCCAQHKASGTKWEYKVAYPDPTKPESSRSERQTVMLNDAAKEGWILVQKDADGGFIFKRAKK